jgi:hypothetical protein
VDLYRPFTVITPTADGDALSVLARADRGFTAPEVQRLAGQRSVEGIRQALKRLEEQGIVHASQAGNAVLFSLNREHLAAGAVIQLATLRDELIARIQNLVQGWSPPCDYAALFGSAALGNMRPTSDIDILVVRANNVDPDAPAWREQIETLRRSVEGWTGNDPQVLELDQAIAVAQAHDADSFLRDVERDGIWLAGESFHIRQARSIQVRS